MIAKFLQDGREIPIDMTGAADGTMRRELKAEVAREEYFEALAEFQSPVPAYIVTK